MDRKIGSSAKSVTKLSEKNYQPKIVVIHFMKRVDKINENSKICKEEQKHNFLKKQLKKTEEKIFGQVQRNTENNVIIRFMKKSDQTTENANTNRKISDFCYQLKKDTVKRKSNLNTTHLKSKFYDCKDCNVSFTRRDNLQCHRFHGCGKQKLQINTQIKADAGISFALLFNHEFSVYISGVRYKNASGLPFRLPRCNERNPNERNFSCLLL